MNKKAREATYQGVYDAFKEAPSLKSIAACCLKIEEALRKISNKNSAKASRKRKKEAIAEMEQMIFNFEARDKQHEKTIKGLKARIKVYEAALLDHQQQAALLLAPHHTAQSQAFEDNTFELTP